MFAIKAWAACALISLSLTQRELRISATKYSVAASRYQTYDTNELTMAIITATSSLQSSSQPSPF